ncbi:hypothetical protein BH10ACI3_BH10ACI3_28910 [soil metagenome]
MNYLKIFVILSAFCLFAIACGQNAQPSNNANKPANTAAANVPPPTVNKMVEPAKEVAEVASGKELYATNCMTCHRDTGKGGKVTIDGKKLEPSDLTSDKMKKRDDAKMLAGIQDGVEDEGMPAFKGKLKDDEIKAIVAHVRTLQGQ